jgi:hypothetical protein
MKNLRNKNYPVNADLVQVYLESAWDKVEKVYSNLDDITTVADAIDSGTLDDFLTVADIDTLAELNAILTDATLGDAADFATAAQGAKVDFLTVTQPVDLDQLEARVNDLDAAVVLRGTWDASSGSFPGSGTAQAGDSWIVNVAGTVDSVDFAVDDRIIAVLDNASTSIFAGNWHKADYTDLVTSVAGLTGAITDVALRSAINVEDGATADQTNAEIRAAVEAAADSNVFTDADHSKLDGIESAATADQTDAEIRDAYHNLITLVSQAEAEAGTGTTLRTWTAQRVAQAIAAQAGGGGGGGLTWNIQGDSNWSPTAENAYAVDGLSVTRTATLPASPAVGDTIVIWNNDGTAASPYNVNIDAGGTNEITELNVNYVSLYSGLAAGDIARLVCYDAGATKRWYMHTARSTIKLSAGLGTQTYEVPMSEERWQLAVGCTWGNINAYLGSINFANSSFPQANFGFKFPKAWDGGQIRYRVFWSPSSADTGYMQMYMIAHAVGDGEDVIAGGTADGLLQDTALGVALDLQVTAWSSWITLDGSPTEDKLIIGRLQRQAASDTFTGVVQVAYLEIQYVTNALNDD